MVFIRYKNDLFYLFIRHAGSLSARTLSVSSTVVLPKQEQGQAQSGFSVNVGMNERVVSCRAYTVSALPVSSHTSRLSLHPGPGYLTS